MKTIANLWLNIRPYWSKLYRFLFEWIYKNDIPLFANDEQISAYMKENFSWKQDTWYMLFDVISKPEKIYETCYDDCDGYSSFSCYCLRQIGILSVMITFVIKPIKKSHTICLYRINDKYKIMDNGTIVDLMSIEALFSYMEVLGKTIAWDALDINLNKICNNDLDKLKKYFGESNLKLVK